MAVMLALPGAWTGALCRLLEEQGGLVRWSCKHLGPVALVGYRDARLLHECSHLLVADGSIEIQVCSSKQFGAYKVAEDTSLIPGPFVGLGPGSGCQEQSHVGIA